MKIDLGNYYISELDTAKPELFYALIEKNRPRLEDFFAGTVRKTRSLEETMAYCQTIAKLRKEKAYLPYTVSKPGKTDYIGFLDVKNIDLTIPKAELGYFIDAGFEGQGIISKALEPFIQYLISTYRFKKLLCRVGSENQGSIKVALNNGFTLEGTIRRDYITTRNQLVDLNYYGRIFD
ncbi:GNAT family protein [Flavobacteriaceae bacterium 3-367]